MQESNEKRIAFNYYKEGKLLFFNGLIEDSTEKYQKALGILEKYNDDKNIAKLKVGIGLNNNLLGNYDKALEFLNEAYIKLDEYKRDNKNLEILCLCSLELSKSNLYKGNLKKSLILSNKALKLSKEANNSVGYSIILILMGKCYEKRGWILKALSKYNKSLKIAEQENILESKSEVLIHLANLQLSLKIYKEAFKNFQLALQIKTDLNQFNKVAEIRDKLATIFELSNNYKEALLNCKIALKIYCNNKLYIQYGRCLIHKGMIHKKTGDYNSALKHFKNAKYILERRNDKVGLSTAINNMGLIYCLKEDYKVAETYFLESLDLLSNTNAFDKILNHLANINAIYYYTHDLMRAYLILNEIKMKAESDNNRNLVGLINLQIADNFKFRGNYQKAILILKNTIDIFQETKDKPFLIKTLITLAYFYVKLNDYNEATSLYNKAKVIGDKFGDKISADLDDQIGRAYQYWGKKKRALEYFYRAKKMRIKTGNTIGILVSASNIGQIYIAEDLEIAQRIFEGLLKKAEALNYIKAITNSLLHLGIIKLKKEKNFQEALDLFKKARNYYIDQRDLKGYTLSSRYIGECYLNLGDQINALIFMKLALKNSLNFSYDKESMFAFTDLGRVYEMIGKNMKAEKHYLKAIEISNKLTLKIRSEELRISFRESLLFPYDYLINLYSSQYKENQDILFLAKLLKILEQVRSQEMMNNIKYIRSFKTSPEEPQKKEREQNTKAKIILELENEIEEKRIQIRELDNYRISLSEKGESNILVIPLYNNLMEELMGLEEDYREFYYIKGYIYEARKEHELFSNIQEIVEKEKMVIWDFFTINLIGRNNDKIYILKISFEGLELLESESIQKNRLLKLVNDFHKDQDFSKLKAIQEILNSIFPKKLIKDIKNFKKLMIIPHDYIFQIPIELVDDIGLKLPIFYCFSLSLFQLLYINYNSPESNRFLMVTNPDPNIASKNLDYNFYKLKDFCSIFKECNVKIDLLSEKQATKYNFIKQIDKCNYNLIHFSGHAKFAIYNSNPWSTVLQFYHPNGRELLTLSELSLLKFRNFPLIIMDGCETSRGTSSRINESLNIARILINNGAGSVISSNWSYTNDISYRFWRKYYEYLLHHDVAESLFKTRKYLAEEFPESFYWLTFSLTGYPNLKYDIYEIENHKFI